MMTFLERLDFLMRMKGVNKAQMAAGCGLGKTTVYAWWDKGYEGITLPKLLKLCSYFGCTLDYLVCGDDSERTMMSESERALLSAYRSADERAQGDALKMLLDHPRE